MINENGRPGNCENPIEAAILADYWISTLPEPEEKAIEEHLLGCDECGAQLREVIALAETIRNLAREGSLRMIVTQEYLDRAAAQGLRVHQYDVPAGGNVQCTVTAEDNILIGRLAVNLKGAKTVDLSICDERGREQLRLRDIPVRPGAGSVIYQESITFAKASPANTMIARLYAVDETGAERLLGEYTFNHTRTLPGPGSWQIS